MKRLDVADGIWEAELSPDGAWIVYRTNDGGVDANIHARRVAGDTTSRPVVASPADERNPTLSPDGRSLAYSSKTRPTGATSSTWPRFPTGARGSWCRAAAAPSPGGGLTVASSTSAAMAG